MKIKTAAKINLALDVTGRLENGYHLLESVFQTVGLYDEITVELTEKDISISCELPEMFADSDPIPCDERNIAYKAAKLFFEFAGIDSGCRIHIRKGIPSQAGMGGGSTDAAAVLYCLSKLSGRELPQAELAAMGKKLGADVPFFFTGGTAFVSGIGEEIAPLPDWSGRTLVIAKGKEGVSTGEAYSRIDALTLPVHPDAKGLVEAIKSSPDKAHRFFGNLFEQTIRLDEIERIKSEMRGRGALASLMTGSGSAVFGLFSSDTEADSCAEELRKMSFFAQTCKTVSASFIDM